MPLQLLLNDVISTEGSSLHVLWRQYLEWWSALSSPIHNRVTPWSSGGTDGVGTGKLSRNIRPWKSNSVPSNIKEEPLTCTSQGVLYLCLSKEGLQVCRPTTARNYATLGLRRGRQRKKSTLNSITILQLAGQGRPNIPYLRLSSQSVISLIEHRLVDKETPFRNKEGTEIWS
jgi:hypothetical protein